jgi:hypothetical protein
LINNPYVYKLQFKPPYADYTDSVIFNGRYTEVCAEKLTKRAKADYGLPYIAVLDQKLVNNRRVNLKDRRQK